ncbi:MAG: hypothetical protein J5726_06780 [Treponema sp.]|nr:hypothetical protein [Treponema sp.]
MFSSCIDSPSYNVYSESWFDTTGYVVTDENGSYSFVAGTTNKPANQAKAILWEHRYIRTPVCELTPQIWDSENIEYRDIESRPIRFEITSTPRNINGLIFYRDTDKVYVINNKYDTYRDKDFFDKDQYRFKIEISGIRDLEFKMVKNNATGNW